MIKKIDRNIYYCDVSGGKLTINGGYGFGATVRFDDSSVFADELNDKPMSVDDLSDEQVNQMSQFGGNVVITVPCKSGYFIIVGSPGMTAEMKLSLDKITEEKED